MGPAKSGHLQMRGPQSLPCLGRYHRGTPHEKSHRESTLERWPNLRQKWTNATGRHWIRTSGRCGVKANAKQANFGVFPLFHRLYRPSLVVSIPFIQDQTVIALLGSWSGAERYVPFFASAAYGTKFGGVGRRIGVSRTTATPIRLARKRDPRSASQNTALNSMSGASQATRRDLRRTKCL